MNYLEQGKEEPNEMSKDEEFEKKLEAKLKSVPRVAFLDKEISEVKKIGEIHEKEASKAKGELKLLRAELKSDLKRCELLEYIMNEKQALGAKLEEMLGVNRAQIIADSMFLLGLQEKVTNKLQQANRLSDHVIGKLELMEDLYERLNVMYSEIEAFQSEIKAQLLKEEAEKADNQDCLE